MCRIQILNDEFLFNRFQLIQIADVLFGRNIARYQYTSRRRKVLTLFLAAARGFVFGLGHFAFADWLVLGVCSNVCSFGLYVIRVWFVGQLAIGGYYNSTCIIKQDNGGINCLLDPSTPRR